MAAAVSTLLLAAALICAAARLSTVDAKYIESVAANVDGVATLDDVTADGHHKAGGGGAGGKLPSPRRHEPFVPMVAFKCGYRNKYMERSGEWRDDASSAASCLQGKYDILKYCKRVYPTLDITNIVEYSHLSHIGKWCKEDGSACKHHYTVRPYRCIAGEFVTESLQVPSRCRFSHVAGKSKCNDYKYWSLRAESECGLKEEEDTHQSMKLHSFAILEPCGLSMFRGVEFVCCPKSVEEKIEQVVDLAKDTDEDDYDDDDDDDDQDDSSESREDLLDSSDKEQDPYFKEDPNHAIDEHERFRDAEERLEKKHRKKVTKVITEWSELFERYNKMKEKDPKGAEEYKREMTARFRKTVAALEEENKEQRTQIEEIHDERVQSALNEKKRQATHDYRAALVKQVGGAGAAANRQNVLKTLKNYIRAEEKDRTHMLNRYRHLLRADPEAAVSFEPILLHRLRYIDLRVNGTLAMLHDFPALEKQIRPVAIEYWNEYRRDNTPELVVAEVSGSDTASLLGGGEEQNERLIRFYKQTYERTHPGSSGGDATLPSSPSSTSLAVDRVAVAAAAKKVGASTATTKRASLKMVAPTELPLEEDSDEDQFDDDDEDEAEEEKLEQQKQKNQQPVDVKKQSEKFDKKLSKDGAKKLVGVLPKKTLKKLEEEESTRNANKGDDDQNDDDEDDDDDDDDDDEDSSSSSSSSSSNDDDEERYVGDAERKALRERQLNVAIEPILGTDGGPQLRVHEEVAEVQPAYARRHDMLVAYNENRSPFAAVWENHTNVALGVIVCAFVVLVVGFMVKRRAAHHPGFIEVDVCTPEDHHIAGMQVNGYENPTYTFYDGGATAKA